MKTKKTLKETVVEGIYREIEEGIYKPNDIIHEGEIMEKYAMSKSPVREALIELCKDNVLKSIPRVGYQVVPVTLKEILDLLEFRIDVETGNLRRLCQRITPEQIEDLRMGLTQQFGGAVLLQIHEMVAIHWNRNTDFHLKLCEMGGNGYICDVIAAALQKSCSYISQYFQTAWKKNAESNSFYHREIIEALVKHDTERAVEMLQKDILNVKEQIQENYSL